MTSSSSAIPIPLVFDELDGISAREELNEHGGVP